MPTDRLQEMQQSLRSPSFEFSVVQNNQRAPFHEFFKARQTTTAPPRSPGTGHMTADALKSIPLQTHQVYRKCVFSGQDKLSFGVSQVRTNSASEPIRRKENKEYLANRPQRNRNAPCMQEEGVRQQDVAGGAGGLDNVLAGGRQESSAGSPRQLRS